jgi:esterase/lipase
LRSHKPITLLALTSPLQGSAILRDVSQDLQKSCVTTYALMLTGSGTNPGDLLSTRAETWNKEVNYAINTIKKNNPNTSLVLMADTDATRIALLAALNHQNEVKALLLFQPSIVTRSTWKLTKWLRYIKPWYIRAHEDDYTAYNSVSFNEVYQKTVLKNEIDQKLKKSKQIKQPVFIIEKYINYNKKYRKLTHDNMLWILKHTQNHTFLIYASEKNKPTELKRNLHVTWLPKDPDINNNKIYNSLFHPTLLTVSKDNEYYGSKGTYRGCVKINKKKKYTFDICGKKKHDQLSTNLNKPGIYQFYWYNPDFDNMMKHVIDFLNKKVRTIHDDLAE